MDDERQAFFRGLADYLLETGNGDVVLHDLGHEYFRAIRIAGVPAESGKRWALPHWAVCVTLRGNKRMGRDAGNRFELVLPGGTYDRILAQHSAITEEIPGTHWISPEKDRSATGHVEVSKPDNLGNPTRWTEDFKWFVENLRLFQRVIGPHVARLDHPLA